MILGKSDPRSRIPGCPGARIFRQSLPNRGVAFQQVGLYVPRMTHLAGHVVEEWQVVDHALQPLLYNLSWQVPVIEVEKLFVAEIDILCLLTLFLGFVPIFQVNHNVLEALVAAHNHSEVEAVSVDKVGESGYEES